MVMGKMNIKILDNQSNQDQEVDSLIKKVNITDKPRNESFRPGPTDKPSCTTPEDG